MMCELGNDHAGQFFTPYDVCRCMAEITFDPKLHPDMEGFISVSDPACGAGATLLAFLKLSRFSSSSLMRRQIAQMNLLFEPKGEPAKIEKTDIKPANLQKSIKNEPKAPENEPLNETKTGQLTFF